MSAKTRTFQADIAVTDEAVRSVYDLGAHVNDSLAAKLTGTLRGPRGGQYELVGPITWLGSSQDYGEDFLRNVVRFAARRQGKYVRPRKLA